MSKGFEMPVRSVTVGFDEGHELHGLEIEFRLNVSTDFYLQVMEFADKINDENDDVTTTLRKTREAMVEFGDGCLIGWNLERNGKPVPATGDALAAVMDPYTAAEIMGRWGAAVGRVPDPLVEPSAPTSTSTTPKQRRRRPRSSARSS